MACPEPEWRRHLRRHSAVSAVLPEDRAGRRFAVWESFCRPLQPAAPTPPGTPTLRTPPKAAGGRSRSLAPLRSRPRFLHHVSPGCRLFQNLLAQKPAGKRRSRPKIMPTSAVENGRNEGVSPKLAQNQPNLDNKKARAFRLWPGVSWSRGENLNLRPSGYEPDELTRLLHPAMLSLKLSMLLKGNPYMRDARKAWLQRKMTS